MPRTNNRILVSLVPVLLLSPVLSTGAFAQQSPSLAAGNLVVLVEGCGVHEGTCTTVPNGTGDGTGNSSTGGYGDNQAAPLTLFQYTPNGTSAVTFVNSLVLPQTGSGANLPVSGSYGSQSEGTLQLSGVGQYVTLMGYGINAATFDAAYATGFTQDPYGAAPTGALGQSGSLTGQSYTAVPRVVTLIDPYGNVNSATGLYNIFNTNNPRSIYTADGVTAAYVSGQGTGCDLTGGVFYTPLGAPNNAPTAITGGDAAPTSSCVSSGYTGSMVAQDTRDVQIYANTLYVSTDSTEGKSDNRSLIGTLGSPPATTLFSPTDAPTGDTGGPNLISGLGNSGGTGKETMTSGVSGNGNSFNAGLQINLSPQNYFFASPSVLYVADDGNPKQTSADSTLGDGGLQKWINSAADGSGTWSLAYTLYEGLNLVENATSNAADTSGTTGLYGVAGTVSGGNVYLYATNYTISDLDPTYLYGITDVVSATTNPGTSFTQLDAAPSDSSFKGLALAPSLPPGSATITSSPSGLAVTSAGTGCVPGTYTTPVTLVWTAGSSCTLSVTSPAAGATGTQYAFAQWQDGTTGTSDTVTAPSTSAVYTATFTTDYELTTAAGTGGTVSAGGYFAAGSNAVITATPSAGYTFVNFTGSTTSTSNPLTLPMTGPESITANFAGQSVTTLKFASISTQVEGAAPFAVSATSASSGAVTYAVTSGPATIAGDLVTVTGVGTVVLTATQAASGSYAAATATASFTVVVPFTLGIASGSSASSTVAAGAAASFSLALTPATGTTLSHALALTATGLPSGATATFSPATIAAGSAATTVTLSIQTSSTQTARSERPFSGDPLAPVALGFLLLPLLGMKTTRKRLRQMPRLPLALLVVGLSLGAVLGIGGCSGSSASSKVTASETYTVGVTATDATTGIASSTNLTLTVQ